MLTYVGTVEHKMLPVPNRVSAERTLRWVSFQKMSPCRCVHSVHSDVGKSFGVFSRDFGVKKGGKKVTIDATTNPLPPDLLVLQRLAEKAKTALIENGPPKREVSPRDREDPVFEVGAVESAAEKPSPRCSLG